MACWFVRKRNVQNRTYEFGNFAGNLSPGDIIVNHPGRVHYGPVLIIYDRGRPSEECRVIMGKSKMAAEPLLGLRNNVL